MESRAFIVDNHLCVSLRVSENASDADADARTPVHFCVVLDNSGSMDSDSKMKNVKKSLGHIVDILGSLDKVSIIAFSDVVEMVVERATVNGVHHKTAICNRIDRIYSDGGTNLSAGILGARGCLQNGANEKQGILLLTDGHANQGVTDEAGILRIIGSIIEEFPGTSISCVGYGLDHNAEMLRKIASVGGGSYNIVQNAEDVATVFGDILGGLSSCAFQQVEVTLPPGLEQVTKYGSRIVDGGGSRVLIGDLQTGNGAMIVARGCDIMSYGINTVGISCFDISKMCAINNNIDICTEPDINIQREGKIAILRCKVVDIIETVRSGWNATIDTKLQEVRRDILHLQSEKHNVVLDLLLGELAFIESSRSEQPNLQLNSMYSQHEAVIGTTRGIWQTPAHVRNYDPEGEEGDEDPVHMIASPNITACFSNYLQRRTSEQVRSYILPPPPPATRQIAAPMSNMSVIDMNNPIGTSVLNSLDADDLTDIW